MGFATKFIATAAVLGVIAFAPAASAGGTGGSHGDCRYNCSGSPSAHAGAEANAWAQGGNATNNNTIRNDNTNVIDNDNQNWNSNENQNWNENSNENWNQNDNRNSNANNNANNNSANASNSNTNNAQNTNTVTANGGSATASNSNTNSADNSNSNNSSQNVNVNTNYQRDPVNTAYAAGLSAGEDTCMGSSSMGAQGVTFGLSIGTTWRDRNCQRLKNSRQLVALGYHGAATALMCVDRDVREAMEQAGTPCPTSGSTQPAAFVAPAPVEQAPAPVAVVAPAPVVAAAEEPAPRPRRHRRFYGEKSN